MKKTNQSLLEFPSDMPPDVREVISRQFRDWKNAQEIETAVEAARAFDEDELEKLNTAAEQIAGKLGISEYMAELTQVLNARADRVDAVLSEHPGTSTKDVEGD